MVGNPESAHGRLWCEHMLSALQTSTYADICTAVIEAWGSQKATVGKMAKSLKKGVGDLQKVVKERKTNQLNAKKKDEEEKAKQRAEEESQREIAAGTALEATFLVFVSLLNMAVTKWTEWNRIEFRMEPN